MNEKIYNYLLANKIFIEKDLFEYGFFVLCTYTKYLLFIIPISLLFNIFWETIFFVIFFIPLRRFIGGFHLNNYKMCFFCSVILAIAIPYFAKNIVISTCIPISLIYLFCLILTKKYGVIEHPNKEITESEKKTYLTYSLVIETFYYCISVFSFFYFDPIIHNILLLILSFFIVSMCLCTINFN